MNTQTGFAEVSHGKLYYEAAGEGEPLILIHGFTLDRRMWDSQFAAFTANYRVIRYDLRGFGHSTLPNESYSHREDLKELMQKLGLASAHLIGLSRGGAVALDFVLAYPQQVRSLVLADAVLFGFKWSAEQAAEDSALWKTAAREGVNAAKAQWLKHSLFRPAQRNARAVTQLSQILTDYSGWHFVNNDPHQYPEPPASQRLGEIDKPTLILVGEYDVPDFQAIAQTLAANIKGARHVVLPQAGHMSNMEAPLKFNRATLEFLAQVH